MAGQEYVGVDGCRYGWFSVALNETGYDLSVCRTFRQLLDCYHEARLILVDMQIGLPQGAAWRACDEQARQRVRNFTQAVFPTPTRETIEQVGALPEGCLPATHLRYRFEQACVQGINLQTFAIVHKIAEVDQIMRERPINLHPEVREVHPEVCFWALNGEAPLQYRKKEPGGLGEDERLAILGNVENRADQIFEAACVRFPRADVGKDDILDALAAAVTAYQSQGVLETLPDEPPEDPVHGHLNMEMVYWVPQ